MKICKKSQGILQSHLGKLIPLTQKDIERRVQGKNKIIKQNPSSL